MMALKGPLARAVASRVARGGSTGGGTAGRVTGSNVTVATFRERLHALVAHHAEGILAEIAPTIRRLRIFLLVATISVPLLIGGLVAVLWHAVH